MNRKKLFGAIASAAVFIVYFGIIFLVFFAAGVSTGDLPISIFILVCFFLLIPLIGIIAALISRIEEIKSGEEEEAEKY